MRTEWAASDTPKLSKKVTLQVADTEVHVHIHVDREIDGWKISSTSVMKLTYHQVKLVLTKTE